MRVPLAATAAFVLTIARSPSAHRLDEYLQAARVSLERTQVTLEVDLTPGASVADGIIAAIDRDGDKAISPVEAERYGREVLSDVVFELDGRPIALTLSHVEVPSADEMRHGVGTIQLRASGDVEPRMSLRRHVHFQNNHRAASSVYVVNALMPGDRGIEVVSQTRDAQQRDVRIEYRVSPLWPKYLYWPILGLVAGGWWFMRTRGSTTNH